MREELNYKMGHDVHSGQIFPLDMPQVNPVYARLANSWYKNPTPVDVNVNGLRVLISPSYYTQKQFENTQSCFILRCAQAEIMIRPDRQLISSLLSTLSDEVDVARLSGEDQALLIELLFTPIIEMFEKKFSSTVRLYPSSREFERDPEKLLTGAVRVLNSDTVFFFQMASAVEHLEFWRDLFRSRDTSGNPDDLFPESLVNVPLTINHKSFDIDLRTLSDLESGDIVLLGSSEGYKNRLDLYAGGQKLWQAKQVPGNDAVQITSAYSKGINAATSGNFHGGKFMSNNNEQNTIDDISVSVSFELGRKDVSVKQLRDLQAGSIVNFPSNGEGEVQIVVSGKEIGWGKLVRVGDDVGVKIERIFVNG